MRVDNRSIDLIKNKKCVGCMLCMAVCPTQSISFFYDELGFKHPRINKTKCINCGLCLLKCPVNIPKKNPNLSARTVFGFQNMNDEILKASSSGGFFGYLANELMKRSGATIFGAAFSNKYDLEIKSIKNSDNLQPLLGSKYIQASTEKMFSISIMTVLFSCPYFFRISKI